MHLADQGADRGQEAGRERRRHPPRGAGARSRTTATSTSSSASPSASGTSSPSAAIADPTPLPRTAPRHPQPRLSRHLRRRRRDRRDPDEPLRRGAARTGHPRRQGRRCCGGRPSSSLALPRPPAVRFTGGIKARRRAVRRDLRSAPSRCSSATARSAGSATSRIASTSPRTCSVSASSTTRTRSLQHVVAPSVVSMVLRAMKHRGEPPFTRQTVDDASRFVTSLVRLHLVNHAGLHIEALGDATYARLEQLQLIRCAGDQIDLAPASDEPLDLLAGLMENLIESQCATAQALLMLRAGPMAREAAEVSVLDQLHRRFLVGDLRRHESCQRPLVKVAIDWLREEGIVEQRDDRGDRAGQGPRRRPRARDLRRAHREARAQALSAVLYPPGSPARCPTGRPGRLQPQAVHASPAAPAACSGPFRRGSRAQLARAGRG